MSGGSCPGSGCPRGYSVHCRCPGTIGTCMYLLRRCDCVFSLFLRNEGGMRECSIAMSQHVNHSCTVELVHFSQLSTLLPVHVRKDLNTLVSIVDNWASFHKNCHTVYMLCIM